MDWLLKNRPAHLMLDDRHWWFRDNQHRDRHCDGFLPANEDEFRVGLALAKPANPQIRRILRDHALRTNPRCALGQ
jgi:hypothetical protein